MHQTLFCGHSPQEKPSIRTHNNSKDGQKQAGFGDHAQITHPTEGLDILKAESRRRKTPFFKHSQRQKMNAPTISGPNFRPGLKSPDHTLDTDADPFPSVGSASTTRSTSIAGSPAVAWAIPVSAEPAEAFCGKSRDASRNGEYVQNDWGVHVLENDR